MQCMTTPGKASQPHVLFFNRIGWIRRKQNLTAEVGGLFLYKSSTDGHLLKEE